MFQKDTDLTPQKIYHPIDGIYFDNIVTHPYKKA